MARRGGAGARHAKGERADEEVGHRRPGGGQDLGLEGRRGGCRQRRAGNNHGRPFEGRVGEHRGIRGVHGPEEPPSACGDAIPVPERDHRDCRCDRSLVQGMARRFGIAVASARRVQTSPRHERISISPKRHVVLQRPIVVVPPRRRGVREVPRGLVASCTPRPLQGARRCRGSRGTPGSRTQRIRRAVRAFASTLRSARRARCAAEAGASREGPLRSPRCRWRLRTR